MNTTIPPPPTTREQQTLERIADLLAGIKVLLGVLAGLAVFAVAVALVMLLA